ncbi:FHA domain-containing protein [Piscinibacter sakaiensis]|uniref:FHA domain protein n=1 Tax=Piscinibacter sakaiensis TaxID=1547922 RepID=A0A0K8P4T0_PISS1|nr:FHA domain-containing protein [Piscinibacter sakaiensis]GAP37631.1 FHA domain protein [Piscinibacter sakaiensis]
MDDPARRLALIECLERDGRPGRVVDVRAWPLTIGRAFDNDLVIDDPHVAPHHARLELDAAGLPALAVLDTVNGARVDGRRLASGARQALPATGAALQFGQTRLRLRLPGEVLDAERPLPPGLARSALLVLPLFALILGRHAIELDPGASLLAWWPAVVGWPLAMAGWCAAWALVSKLFQHRFEFVAHLRILLPWLLATLAVGVLLPLLGGALGWPLPWYAAGPLQLLMGAAWIHRHLAVVLPAHRRATGVAIGAAALAALATHFAVVHRDTDRWSRAPYMSALPPPALRLGPTAPPQALVDDLAGVVAPLARQAEEARQEDDERGDGDDEGS